MCSAASAYLIYNLLDISIDGQRSRNGTLFRANTMQRECDRASPLCVVKEKSEVMGAKCFHIERLFAVSRRVKN